MTLEMKSHANTISTGLAMFSMFFGAGNVVFPLVVGQIAMNNNFYAILGLLITAVGVPFTGLIAMTLFNGNYRKFFSRMGKLPGAIITGIIMALIGPFGALPRCIALSYSTSSSYLPGISLPLFSMVACLLIYLLTFRRTNIVDILGKVLTPFLLITLTIIIIKGLLYSPSPPLSSDSPAGVFLEGLKQGYQTMDLLGAFFFSSVVLVCLKKSMTPFELQDKGKLLKMTLQASVIGAILLSLVYIGFSYVAAFHSVDLSETKADSLISDVARLILGKHAGLVVCLAVALACLTTAIALSAVFAEYLHEDITHFKVSYQSSLVVTLIITFFISTLNFTMIVQLLAPILQVCYPALITLSIFNLLYKIYHVETIKAPVYTVFMLSLAYYFLT